MRRDGRGLFGPRTRAVVRVGRRTTADRPALHVRTSRRPARGYPGVPLAALLRLLLQAGCDEQATANAVRDIRSRREQSCRAVKAASPARLPRPLGRACAPRGETRDHDAGRSAGNRRSSRRATSPRCASCAETSSVPPPVSNPPVIDSGRAVLDHPTQVTAARSSIASRVSCRAGRRSRIPRGGG